MQHV
jgi:hypothetical protein